MVTPPETPRELLTWLRERILLEGSQTARREWLPKILATLLARPENAAGTIYVRSMLSHRDHVGRVELALGEYPPVQMPAGQARDVGTWILEAATSAELDQFLFEWARDHIGANDTAAAALVGEFRAFRETKAAEWAAERALFEGIEEVPPS